MMRCAVVDELITQQEEIENRSMFVFQCTDQNEKEEIDASESFHVVLEFDFRTPKKKPAKPPSFLNRKSGAVKAKKKD